MTVACTARAQAPVPGFDTRAYPGDSVMRAWLHPSSPYQWVGYYLAAPCHRDSSFAGKYATLTRMGWGVAAIYVGQQDFSQMPSTRPPAANAPTTPIICSSTLLSTTQGATEAADAIAKMRADGFPPGSAVFLDVEQVTTITPALLDYVRAWIGSVSRNGRYRPGVYATKPNIQDLVSVATAVATATKKSATLPVWVSSGGSFALDSLPAASGFDFATIWQGTFSVSETWNHVTLTIDANVATKKTP
ncbi:MAG TPA: glycoside hydrolase domain-containing protein [Gemmatimonadaceae bacterium]|jgi:hypothetical protein